MRDPFRPVFEGLKQVAEGLILANQGLILANQGVKMLADGVLAARDEHEDLPETVHRLEGLVMNQTHELRAQREEMRALRERLDRRE
jgi:hypothetical protein